MKKYKIGDKINDFTLLKFKKEMSFDVYCLKCKCGKFIQLYEHELDKQNCGKCQKPNSPQYNKGRPEINTPLYNQWRKKVYARCGFKCVICGSTKQLNAHHLDSWSWAINRRYDVDNGTTLCKKHHDEFHNIFGKNHNTVGQFEQFKIMKGVQ